MPLRRNRSILVDALETRRLMAGVSATLFQTVALATLPSTWNATAVATKNPTNPTLPENDPAFVPATIGSSSAVGGGFTNGGLTGQYFNNTDMSGTPAFTRRDVRIDFDWGSTLKPGGSIDPAFASVGTDNYSVKWTGGLVARFSETYTFQLQADDGTKLMIRPAGSTAWTTLIDNWSGSGLTNKTAAYKMVAGQTYDVELDYRELTGNASAKLFWSSPSTPMEVIDPVSQSGINNPDFTAGLTNIVQGATRNTWFGWNGDAAPAQDSSGWPIGSNFGYYFEESLNQGLDLDPLIQGTISFSFNGKSTVRVVGNVDVASLKYTYDAASNLTTGTFVTKPMGTATSSIIFTGATRTAAAGAQAGITNLKLMKPTATNAATSYSTTSGPLFTPQILSTLSNYTLMRYQLVADQQVNWSDRTLPTYFNQKLGQVAQSSDGVGSASNDGASWEYKIMLANEAGADMMISLPPLASDDYIRNLANLIKYGSDANGTPYTKPTANPAYAPLNSNLRVYFEIGNELWNYIAPYNVDFAHVNSMVVADMKANGPDWAAINYDNLSTAQDAAGNYASMSTWRYREIMLRTMQISDIFRSVYGDASMPGTSGDVTVRPLYEWQYANIGNTADIALSWADNYYNNGDGTHVANPMPVNHWLWGGGGATYYSANNPNGLTDQVVNSGFDNVTLSPGLNANPANTGFTFTGTSGIAQYAAGNTLGIPVASNGTQMAYVQDKGSISFYVTVPSTQTSNVYAIDFKALARQLSGSTTADKEHFQVLLNDTTDLDARTFCQSNGYTPSSYAAMGSTWKARNVVSFNSDYYYTKVFTATPGQVLKITIKGMGDVTSTALANQMAFIDDVRLTSADAIYAGGIPGGGEAVGQPVGTNIQNSMNTETNWANAFGLQEVSYEGGWSLGGDDGGSPLQLAVKYGDQRTAAAQQQFMNWFSQSGAKINVFGTYQQWPNWSDFYAQQGLINNASYPIVQGVINASKQLTPEATNGTVLPPGTLLTLTSANATLTHLATTAKVNSSGGWISYNVVASSSGTYQVRLNTGSGGTVRLIVDGKTVSTFASGSSLVTGLPSVFLSKGQHTIKVQSVSGSFAVDSVYVGGTGVQMPGAIAMYDGTGLSAAAQIAATATNSAATASAITRSSAFILPAWLTNGVFGSMATWPTTLAGAISANSYFEFSANPNAGGTLSLQSLLLKGYGMSGHTPTVTLGYSLDGGKTFKYVNSTGPLTALSFDFSSDPAMQAVSGKVTFRAYFYGMSAFEAVGITATGPAAILYGSSK